ncbi:MAG: electron transfer flavoprotein subunit beta, partial [Clostridium cadaveris]|nr:electron transfer flavoprotein subunit beta [Clostridium cadaveris]
LGISQVTYVQAVEANGDKLTINRALENGHEIIEVQTPVLLTAIKELNEPRYMNARDIYESANKEIQIWTADDIDVDKSKLGLSGSPTKVKKSMTKEVKGQGEIVNMAPKDAVEHVLAKLKEKHYI